MMKSFKMLFVGIMIGLIISVPVVRAVQYTLKQSDCIPSILSYKQTIKLFSS